jgi:hypothetical protein
MSDNEPIQATAAIYKDDDLVYVDPDARVVVGLVEFKPDGKAKAMPVKDAKPEVVEEEDDAKGDKRKGRARPRRQRYYPWGTYRSMKKVYKLEGKPPRIESNKTLDEVIEKALQEPFWD